MRNKKTATYLCTGLLLLMTMTAGCGNSNADSDVTTVDSIDFNDVIDTNTEENSSNYQSNKENVDKQQDSSQESNSQSSNGENTNNQSDDSVENGGNQENNNEDLVQQSNSAQSQSDDVQLQPDRSTSQADDAKPQADSKLDGSIESIGDNSVTISKTLHPSENLAVSSNELVTVYFSEETEFEVWTVKNGGVNGDADTEKQQGAFYDLNLGASIRMTGSYDGSDFNANYVIIYNFV